jgi:rubrerythrin
MSGGERLTRSQLLLRAALAAASAAGAGAVGPVVARALAKDDSADLDVLSFALTLEHLQSDLYIHGAKLALSPQGRTLVEELGQQEDQHVAALEAAVRKLGGVPPAKPRFVIPAHDEPTFLRLAQALEDLGVSAYNGAVAAIASPEILAAAATIVQVEARHAAAVRLARAQRPAPDAFDAALDRSQAIQNLRPLLRRR